jgi:hypothetical protein
MKDPMIINMIINKVKAGTSLVISPQKYSSDEYEFRYMEEGDYSRGIFEVLSQLTKAPKPTIEEYRKFWVRQREANCKHINIVGVERKTDKVVAFGTILIANSVLSGRVGKI